MQTYKSFIAQALENIDEIFPWDLEDELANKAELILLDIREQDEYDLAHIPGSLHVPRGILEGACDWGYNETEPTLASSRDQDIVVICRSGNRSALAALTLKEMGFKNIRSLKTGIRGCNDADIELHDRQGNIADPDELDVALNEPVPPEKLEP